MDRTTQLLECYRSKDLWYDFDNNEVITDAKLRKRIEKGLIDPRNVSAQPEIFPVFGNLRKAMAVWLPTLILKEESHEDKIHNPELIKEWARIAKVVRAAEKFGGETTLEADEAYDRGDWKTFSRLRGYTEEEINDFEHLKKLHVKVLREYGEEADDSLFGIEHSISEGDLTFDDIINDKVDIIADWPIFAKESHEDEIHNPELIKEWARYVKITDAAEKESDPKEWSEELRNAYENEDYVTFSRLRGYTEEEIADFGQMMKLTDEVEETYGTPGEDFTMSIHYDVKMGEYTYDDIINDKVDILKVA